MMTENKKCGSCQEIKPLSEYEKDDLFLKTGDRSGLTYYCIDCLSFYRKRIKEIDEEWEQFDYANIHIQVPKVQQGY